MHPILIVLFRKQYGDGFEVQVHKGEQHVACLLLDVADAHLPGIGPKRRKALLTKLGSLKAIREATEEQLLAVPGMTRAAAEAVRKWAEAKKE